MTIAELVEAFLLSLKAEYPDLAIHEGSMAHREATAYAAAVYGLHHRLDRIQRGITPATAATAEELRPHAEAVSVARKGATPAFKAGALQAQGEPGSIIPAGLGLTATGALALRYRTTAEATIGADRWARVSIESIDVGSKTRLTPPQAMTFDAPPAGVSQTAKLVADLDQGGLDAESFGAWKERVLSVWRTKRQGGNAADYATWALELDIVHEAYVYQAKPARGHVAIAALKIGTDASRVLDADQRARLQAYLDARRPICDDVHVIATLPKPSHGTVTLTMAPGFETTWTGSAMIESYDATAKTITVDAVPAGLTIGSTLTVASADPDARAGIGRPCKVSSVSGTTISLSPLVGSDPIGFIPEADDTIVPSSPKHYELWQLIHDHIAQLGPANPGRRYGSTWRSDVAVRAIHGLIQRPAIEPYVVDVDVELHQGGDLLAAHEHAWPSLDVELIVPGQWVVQ